MENVALWKFESDPERALAACVILHNPLQAFSTETQTVTGHHLLWQGAATVRRVLNMEEKHHWWTIFEGTIGKESCVITTRILLVICSNR